MLVVASLGGRAFANLTEHPDIDALRPRIGRVADALAAIARAHRLVVVHGFGDCIAAQAIADDASLDVLAAESHGVVGHLLALELGNRLAGGPVVSLLSRVVVAEDGPAGAGPSRPIGPLYDAVHADALVEERGWAMGGAGAYCRQLVPVAEPLAVTEVDEIGRLADSAVVLCGGIAVALGGDGRLQRVDALAPEEQTAALLACELGAGAFLVLTGTPALYTHPGTPNARPLRWVTPDELRDLPWEPGTVRPKVDAVRRFVERTGCRAAIGAGTDAAALLEGRVGTQVVAEHVPLDDRVRSPLGARRARVPALA